MLFIAYVLKYKANLNTYVLVCVPLVSDEFLLTWLNRNGIKYQQYFNLFLKCVHYSYSA